MWVNRAIRENGKVLFSEEAVSLTCSLIKMEIGLPLTKEEKQKEKQFTEKK
jgi:DNA sulfur modification protein DndB